MTDDPIVQEIRKIRKGIEREHHNSIQEICKEAMKLQKGMQNRLVDSIPHTKHRYRKAV